MTLSGNEIRNKFISYFSENGHAITKSASLIPANDPTLYFVNAGMVPFKNYFTGEEQSENKRAVSSQKCMRVSGKHNDLENVGRTARHHTFFEMLGNFSFGDYFKKEAINFAWNFLTNEIGLPKDKLLISVFETDDEAFDIWNKEIGIDKSRIARMGEKDNFWSMGDTGPCGPCSEIHYAQDISCTLGNKKCSFGKCDCDKYLEIWNLVFMQFERHEDGTKTPLPKPSVDTGMGLERLSALLQGKSSNYDSDLFMPILKEIQKVTVKKYGENDEHDVSMRVLADHIRASVFLINDGVLPSNEGRGYVLRRILRRAIRHGKLLGQTQAFFYKLIPVVITEMSAAYPDLKSNQDTIEKVIHAEEDRFFETLEKGLKILSEEMTTLEKSKKKTLPGEVAFKLYDTFGFPLDLTQTICEDNNIKVDQDGFEKEMTLQKERARAGWKGSGADKIHKVYFDLSEKQETKFLGYDTLESPAKISAIIIDGKIVDEVKKGDCELVFDQTPFYAESGGQAGDAGKIKTSDSLAEITDTQKPVGSLFVHKTKILKGTLKAGDTVQLSVFKDVRLPTMRNHTATHIMHAALRNILGSHVRQAGSLVNDEVLRFDFSHFEGISPEILKAIEDEVNTVVLNNHPVEKKVMSHDQAIKEGALAFFGDKYGDEVRVIGIGDYSVELCGGTHLNHTSEIGFFKIISEGSIAAGVRRIEAVTGMNAIKMAQEEAALLKKTGEELKSTPKDIPDTVKRLQAKLKTQNKEIDKLKKQLLSGGSEDYLKDATEINNVKTVVHESSDIKSAREIATVIRDKLGSGISVVSAKEGEKSTIVVSVTKDLMDKYPANKILQPLGELINGRGGGKADIAQAGGSVLISISDIQDKLKSILT